MNIYWILLLCMQSWWFVLFDIGLPYSKWVMGFGAGGAMATILFKAKENDGVL